MDNTGEEALDTVLMLLPALLFPVLLLVLMLLMSRVEQGLRAELLVVDVRERLEATDTKVLEDHVSAAARPLVETYWVRNPRQQTTTTAH